MVVFYFFSLAIHPNKMLVATGQSCSHHDKLNGRVSVYFTKNILIKNTLSINTSSAFNA